MTLANLNRHAPMKPQPPSQGRRSPSRKPRVRKSTLWDSSHTPVISDKRRHFARLELEVVPLVALDGTRDDHPTPPTSTSTARPTTTTFRSYPQPPRTAPAADDSKRYDTPERRAIRCVHISGRVLPSTELLSQVAPRTRLLFRPPPTCGRYAQADGNGWDDGRRSGPRSRLAAPNAGALLLRLYRRSVDIEKVFAAAQRRCQKVARVAVDSEWELHIENFTKDTAEQEVRGLYTCPTLVGRRLNRVSVSGL